MRFPTLRRATMVAAVVLAALGGAFPGSEFVCPVRAEEPDHPVGRDVDVDAVRRMGSVVQRLGTFGAEDDVTNAFVNEMAAVPPDDNAKWFVTVVGIRGCTACEQLVAKWPHDELLRALADPNDRAKSWAHFNYYRADDKLHAKRFANLKFEAFPTILVQPPLKGRGDPTSVVAQCVYRGDSAATVAFIAGKVRDYMAKLAPRVSAAERDDGVEPVSGWGQSPSAAGDAEWNLRRPFFHPSPRPATPTTPPFDTPVAPPATPSVVPAVAPVLTPFDGLQIPPAVLPPPTAPPAQTNPTPSVTVPAAPSSVEDLPEAFLITDAEADQASTEDGRLHLLVEQMKAKIGGKIRTRPVDWVDAKERFPMLRRDELPAVVLTDKGRVVDKITNRMFPLVKTATGVFSLFSDFPWQTLVSIFTSGPSWAAFTALGIWILSKVRKSRTEAGKPVVAQELFDAVTNAATPTPEAQASSPAPTAQRRQVGRRRSGSRTSAAPAATS